MEPKQHSVNSSDLKLQFIDAVDTLKTMYVQAIDNMVIMQQRINDLENEHSEVNSGLDSAKN